MPRFYVDALLEVGKECKLPANVVWHLNVVRQKNAQDISLFNGDGHSYTAQILSLQRKSCVVLVTEQSLPTAKTHSNLHLGLSIIASDKMDLAIRGATELGVAMLTPIISSYAQKISSERLNARMEHWQKIILSSCEQCGQNSIPKLNVPIMFDSFVKLEASGKFILSREKSQTLAQLQLKKSPVLNLLVGPEGGFTASELDLALQNGYLAIKPWHNILRTETAVIAGISLILNSMD